MDSLQRSLGGGSGNFAAKQLGVRSMTIILATSGEKTKEKRSGKPVSSSLRNARSTVRFPSPGEAVVRTLTKLDSFVHCEVTLIRLYARALIFRSLLTRHRFLLTLFYFPGGSMRYLMSHFHQVEYFMEDRNAIGFRANVLYQPPNKLATNPPTGG